MKKSLLALASGTLGLGIAEFVMMGILPNVAHDLNISIPEAGHFISAYAIGVCVGAPLTVFVARTRPLKQILLGLAAIYVIGNLCAALAPEYPRLRRHNQSAGLRPPGVFCASRRHGPALPASAFPAPQEPPWAPTNALTDNTLRTPHNEPYASASPQRLLHRTGLRTYL